MSSGVNQADLIGDSHVGAVSRVASLIRVLLVLSTDHLFLGLLFRFTAEVSHSFKGLFQPFQYL